jgi:adenosylmethionine-8-amino-7-oxononanoate aminotransferase
MAVEAGLDAKRIQELDRQHVLHSWSVQSQLSPIAVAGADGRYFWDHDGNRYLDFASQLVNVNIGHQHPKVVAAIQEQAEKLTTIGPPMAHEARSELARLLAEVTPGDLTMSFFTNGGAEANENALKLARWYTGRHKVIARYRSYHGATAGAITLTGDPRRWHAEPGLPGVVRMLDPYTYRCPAGHPDPCPVCTGGPHLEELLMYEGPETVAAVFLEPVQNAGGCFPPPPGYFQRVREICDRYGVLLVSDEVICAFGRLGHWFGAERYGYQPDIITFAKGLTSGYAPMGGMVCRDFLMEPFLEGQRTFLHGITFAGHPVSSAVALANLDVFEREDLLGNVQANQAGFRSTLEKLLDLPIVGDVRGEGYFYGIELVKDKATRESFDGDESERLLRGFLSPRLFEQGLVCRADDRGDPVIQLSPPLICEQEHFDEIEGVLRQVLSEAWSRL